MIQWTGDRTTGLLQAYKKEAELFKVQVRLYARNMKTQLMLTQKPLQDEMMRLRFTKC